MLGESKGVKMVKLITGYADTPFSNSARTSDNLTGCEMISPAGERNFPDAPTPQHRNGPAEFTGGLV